MTHDIDTRDRIIADLSARLDAAEAKVERAEEVLDRVGIARAVGCATGRRDLTTVERVEQLASRWAFEREWRIKWETDVKDAEDKIDALQDEIVRIRQGIDCEPCQIHQDKVWAGQYACGTHGVVYRDSDNDAEGNCPVGRILAEVERLKAHTWQQERAAVVAWLSRKDRWYSSPFDDAERIEAGEHWLEGGTKP